MAYTTEEILRRIGLSREKPHSGEPVVLSGSAADSRTGLLVSLKSSVEFDDKGQISDIKVQYWRHLPYGESKSQNLLRITMKPSESGGVEPDQIWVQSKPVHEKTNLSRTDVNRVFGAIARLNELLRDNGPVENTAKILDEARIIDVTGEDLVIRGLNREEGGFSFSLASYFMGKAAQGAGQDLTFNNLDRDLLKTMLGFRVNTLEPDKNFTGSRPVYAVDPQSGVEYEAGVRLKETARKLTMEMYITPTDAPDGVDAKAIPDLLSLTFREGKKGSYELEKAVFLGEECPKDNAALLLHVLGFAQACNNDLSSWKFPSFMDHMAEYDLLDMVSAFSTPPALSEGGEFLYGSLHGSGYEKKVENFGDQIGIAALFLHRGLKHDGAISTVGFAVDFPFATGGPDSGYDGAVPDYLPFWDDIKAFAITHDHFDHCDGLPYYALKGLMKDKTIYATDRVKYFLKHKMDNLSVPSNLRPKIVTLDKEGALPLKDEEGNVRMWIQHNPNATLHSALCTPYIVTGCYGDEHYNGSVLIYGDGRGLKEESRPFFQEGPRRIPEFAGEHGLTVTPAKVDRNITTVLHDITAIRYDGRSPTPEEVEKNQSVVLNWFSDKGVIMAPISTNNAEYTVGLNVAHETGRDITAVGGNAETRVSCMNLFGVMPDLDLRTIRIDPLEERAKPDDERILPPEVLEEYFEILDNAAERLAKDDSPDPDLSNEELLQKYREQAHREWSREYTERLPPEKRDHEKDVHFYMIESLMKYGAVVFENDLNGYLMWKAVMDRREIASVRATRTSQMAKDFRESPEDLMIFVTGTQGNSEEKFSTLQKFKDFFSLLDADESVRPTGYKINAEDFVAVITQPSIPGNDRAQEKMINELVRARDITVVGAFMNGFKVYNPKDHRDTIVRDLNLRGWRYAMDPDGGIRVYARPIHIHGHGFAEDMIGMAKTVKADLHECHHVPDQDSYDVFRAIAGKHGINHSGNQPDDFQFFKVNAEAKSDDDKFSIVAHLNPSYILVRMIRKYGHFFGGFMEWTRATMMRREGHNREDGLMARTARDGVYERLTAQVDWEKVCNPDNRANDSERYRKLGPSQVEKDPDRPRRPRSRPLWSNNLPEVA